MRMTLDGHSDKIPFPASIVFLVTILFASILFVDPFNFASDMYASSLLLLNVNPYHFGGTIVTGYPFLLLNYVEFLVYSYISQNVLVASIVFKSILAAFTILSSILLYKITVKYKGKDAAKLIYFAFLFDPFLLFVTFIWGMTDIVVISLLLLTFYFLSYRNSSNFRFDNLFIGLTFLSLSIYSYYFTIFLVPTFLFYRNNHKERAFILIFLLSIMGILSLPILARNLIATGLTGVAHSPIVVWYSYLNLLPTSLENYVMSMSVYNLAIIVILSLLLPLFLRRLKRVEPFSILVTIFLLLLLQPSSIQGDNFVLTIPFIFLSLVYSGDSPQKAISILLAKFTLNDIFSMRKVKSHLSLLILQFFLVPVFLIVNIFNGIDGITGLYYWTYNNLHTPGNLGIYFSEPQTLKSLVSFILLLSFFTMSYLSIAGKNIENEQHNVISPFQGRKHIEIPQHKTSSGALYKLFTLIVIVVICLPLVDMAAQSSNITEHNAINPYFFPSYSTGTYNYVLSSKNTYEFFNNSHNLMISANSEPISFQRNITNQNFVINMTVQTSSSYGNLTGNALIFANLSGIDAGISSMLFPQTTEFLKPNATVNATTVTTSGNWIYPALHSFYSLNGTGVLSYTFNSTKLMGHSIVSLYKLSSLRSGQNMLWTFKTNLFWFEAFIYDGNFYVGRLVGNEWNFTEINADFSIENWFMSGITERNNSVYAFLDNNKISILTGSLAPTNVEFNVGSFSNPPLDSVSITGLTSGLLTMSNLSFAPRGFLFNSESGQLRTFAINQQTKISIFNSNGHAGIKVNNETVSLDSNYKVIQFGKLTRANVSLLYDFLYFQITSLHKTNFNLILIYLLGFVFPISSIYIYYYRRIVK